MHCVYTYYACCGACLWCALYIYLFKYSPSFGTSAGSDDILSQKVYGELISSCFASGGCECDGVLPSLQIAKAI